MKTRFLLFITVTIAVLFFAGCRQSYQDRFVSKAKSAGMTEEEQLDLVYYSYRWRFSKEKKTGVAGVTLYYPRYSDLTYKELRVQLDKWIADLHEAIVYNNEETNAFVRTFNLRADLKREKHVDELIRSAVRAAELDPKFKKLTGQIPDYEMDEAEKYDPKKIFPASGWSGFEAEFPFSSSQIDAAKKDGTLKPIEHGVWTLDRKYAKKIPDPSNLNDPNKFIWESRDYSLDLTNYKIISLAKKPMDNLGNYIEGFRLLTVNGRQEKEKAPALKIFFPDGANGLAVVVMDSKKEGESGFGLPDFVEQITGLASVRGVMGNDHILSTLFSSKDEGENIVPRMKKIYVQIAPIGVPVEIWEKSKDPNGWLVPFKYADNRNSNYNVRIKMLVDPSNPGTPDDFREVKYVIKEWTNGDRYTPSVGSVVEYYHLKPPFEGKVKAKVLSDDDTKKVQFDFPDGTEIIGFVTPGRNKFIENNPYAIEYDFGNQRYLIEKSPSGKIFDERREVAAPLKPTGEYSDSDDTGSSASSDMKTGKNRKENAQHH